ATMDIDYIVFGSKNFVENYKSDLEIAEEKVEKIELIKAPTKNSYYVGENIDLSGLELKATYNDGTSEILTSVGVDYKFEDASDNSVVTLKYGKATATYSVKVIGLEKIEIETMPEKTSYKVSDITDGFVPTGLTAKATFADGSTKILSLAELTIITDFVGSGTQNVTVNYHGAKTYFTIELINIQSITVEPLSTPIYFGTKLTSDDLKITVVYSDGSTDSFADSKLDKNYITATYEPKYGETDITVTYASPSLAEPLEYKTTGTYAKPVSLEVSSIGVKTEYEVDDTFDTTGLQLSLVYENGKKVNIKVEDLTKEPVYDFSSAGDTTVTFNFEELSASLNVNVKAVEIVTRSSTNRSGSSDGAPIGLIVGIVAAVLVIGGVVVFVVLKKKKQ
ncbi:MAG: bacterial Ig-like domain-containing protein, partial [Ruminococcus sp.]|nr:bacterial Ig-like domain-containing protein [Candidatus Apopatosoma intestinale]